MNELYESIAKRLHIGSRIPLYNNILAHDTSISRDHPDRRSVASRTHLSRILPLHRCWDLARQSAIAWDGRVSMGRVGVGKSADSRDSLFPSRRALFQHIRYVTTERSNRRSNWNDVLGSKCRLQRRLARFREDSSERGDRHRTERAADSLVFVRMTTRPTSSSKGSSTKLAALGHHWSTGLSLCLSVCLSGGCTRRLLADRLP